MSESKHDDCAECNASESPHEFIADRADIWHSAVAAMKAAGITDYSPSDVLELAEFLAGDALRNMSD